MKNKKGFIFIWILIALAGAEVLTLIEANQVRKEQNKNTPKDYIQWDNK